MRNTNQKNSTHSEICKTEIMLVSNCLCNFTLSLVQLVKIYHIRTKFTELKNKTQNLNIWSIFFNNKNCNNITLKENLLNANKAFKSMVKTFFTLYKFFCKIFTHS